MVEQLKSCPVRAAPQKISMMPWCLKRLCQQRGELIGCVLPTSLEEGALDSYFLRATKSLVHAMLLPVRMNCDPVPSLLGLSEEGTLGTWDSCTKRGFDFDPGAFVFDQRLEFPAGHTILDSGHPGCLFFQLGCRLVGGREPENLEEVLAQAPAAPAPEPLRPNAKARESAEEESPAECPWLVVQRDSR